MREHTSNAVTLNAKEIYIVTAGVMMALCNANKICLPPYLEIRVGGGERLGSLISNRWADKEFEPISGLSVAVTPGNPPCAASQRDAA